jgi:hypothetical protein
MAKIDTVAGLPAWFDLSKYKPAEGFGAIEWHRQLSARKLLLVLLSYRLEGSSSPVNPVYDDMGETAAKAYREHSEKVLGSVDFLGIPTCELEGARGVENLYPQDLLEHALNTCRDHQEWFDGLVEQGREVLTSRASGVRAITLTTLGSVDREVYATTKVAIDLPDAVLIEGFKSWLSSLRAAQGQAPIKYHRPTYKRWGRYGVLPYLDLTIWAQETGNHIPDRVMSAAISHYDAGEANLRKTVAPIAADLMRDLSELQSLAAVEAATGSPGDMETFDSGKFPEKLDP